MEPIREESTAQLYVTVSSRENNKCRSQEPTIHGDIDLSYAKYCFSEAATAFKGTFVGLTTNLQNLNFGPSVVADTLYNYMYTMYSTK